MKSFLLSLLVLATLTSCNSVSGLLGSEEADIYAEETMPDTATTQIPTGLYPNGSQYGNTTTTAYGYGTSGYPSVNTGTISTTGYGNSGSYGVTGIQSADLPFGESTYNKRRNAVTNYATSGGRYNGADNDETVRITYDANGNEIRDRVFFDYNSTTLNAKSKAVINNQITWLKSNRGSEIVIEGHADERGTREYNLALGDKRAQAVKAYMIINGISRDRIKSVSYGKEQPAVVGSNEYSWSKNRRSVTVLR